MKARRRLASPWERRGAAQLAREAPRDVHARARRRRSLLVQRILFVLLILACGIWFWSLKRAATLFRIDIEEGQVTRVRGRVPPRMLADIKDVALRGGVLRATLRGVMRDGRPVLHFDGELDPGLQQQLRNVMGQFRAHDFRPS